MSSSTTPVWFISAASSGFGKNIALSALKRGHKVIASARSTSKLLDLQKAGADVMALDVTSPLSDLVKIAKEAHARYGRIDYLINAAGYILEGAIEETSPEETFDHFNVNVFGILNTIRAFLPLLRGQEISKTTGSRATIAVFGSLGSWRGGPDYGLYAATKWSISAIAESLRPELAPFDIVATVIEPGYFRTNFLASNAAVSSKVKIDAYTETVVGQVRATLETVNGKQPGDVEKGCEVIVDVLTGKHGEVPIRLVLGTDAYNVIKGKCEETIKLLDEWESTIKSTDYPEGQ